MTNLKTGSSTPWGTAQSVETPTPGVSFVTTAGHGGYHVSDELLDKIPTEWGKYAAKWSHGWGGNWFEEDVAALAPMAYIEGVVPPEQRRKATEAMVKAYGAWVIPSM